MQQLLHLLCSHLTISMGAIAREGSILLSLNGGVFRLLWDILYEHCHVLMLPSTASPTCVYTVQRDAYVFKCFIVPVSAYRVPDNMKCMMHKPFSSLNINAPVFTCGYGTVFISNAL